MTIDALLRAAAARLEPVGGTGRLDAALLLEHVTGTGRASFISGGPSVLDPLARAAFETLVTRRLSGLPIPYITGRAGFYGRTFAVDQRVLVPRPETEHLVEAALAVLRERGDESPRVADVGTGSGAVAITVAAECDRVWAFGTDISRDALAVARDNAARNNVTQRCTFVHGDLAAPLVAFGPFAVVVANLPYVPTADVPAAPDPAGFEPSLALDGGADGLALYRRLLAQLPAIAAPGASIFLEAAPPTIAALAALAATAFPKARIVLGRDYAGLERYVTISS